MLDSTGRHLWVKASRIRLRWRRDGRRGRPLGKDDRFLAFTDKGVGESRSNFYEAKCEAWSQYVQRGALQRQRFHLVWLPTC